MAASDEVAPAREGTSVRTVRQLFAKARSEVNTFQSLHLGRQVAEAVCAELLHSIPADHQAAYRKLDALNKQITYLEDNAGELRVPRAVTAALRTLQAYGNYSSRRPQRVDATAEASTSTGLSHERVCLGRLLSSLATATRSAALY